MRTQSSPSARKRVRQHARVCPPSMSWAKTMNSRELPPPSRGPSPATRTKSWRGRSHAQSQSLRSSWETHQSPMCPIQRQPSLDHQRTLSKRDLPGRSRSRSRLTTVLVRSRSSISQPLWTTSKKESCQANQSTRTTTRGSM